MLAEKAHRNLTKRTIKTDLHYTHHPRYLNGTFLLPPCTQCLFLTLHLDKK